MASVTATPVLSPTEAACVTGVPLKQVRRIIDAGLLDGATSGGKRARAVRREGLLGLKLAHETMDLLTAIGRRRLVRYLLEHPDAKQAQAQDVSVDLRAMKGEVKKGLAALAKARGAVVRDPAILSGVPCLRGTRIPAHDIADMLANGDSAEAIGEAYPRLTKTQIELAALFAKAYPRRGRPRREPFWRSRHPLKSTKISLDDALAAL